MTHLCQWANFQPRKWPNIEQTNSQSGHAAVFFKWANPASLSFIFGLFKQTSLQFLQPINVKKCHVHLENGPEIRTHDLPNMSLLP